MAASGASRQRQLPLRPSCPPLRHSRRISPLAYGALSAAPPTGRWNGQLRRPFVQRARRTSIIQRRAIVATVREPKREKKATATASAPGESAENRKHFSEFGPRKKSAHNLLFSSSAVRRRTAGAALPFSTRPISLFRRSASLWHVYFYGRLKAIDITASRGAPPGSASVC